MYVSAAAGLLVTILFIWADWQTLSWADWQKRLRSEQLDMSGRWFLAPQHPTIYTCLRTKIKGVQEKIENFDIKNHKIGKDMI